MIYAKYHSDSTPSCESDDCTLTDDPSFVLETNPIGKPHQNERKVA